MKKILIALMVFTMLVGAFVAEGFGQRYRHRRFVRRYYYVRPYRVRRPRMRVYRVYRVRRHRRSLRLERALRRRPRQRRLRL